MSRNAVTTIGPAPVTDDFRTTKRVEFTKFPPPVNMFAPM